MLVGNPPGGERRARSLKVAVLYGADRRLALALPPPVLPDLDRLRRAYADGWRVRLWDFLFYASFGVVVTSSVRIAGVLLVFSYLIVPALAGHPRSAARSPRGCSSAGASAPWSASSA